MSFKPNPLFRSDAYKIGHKRMLASGTTKLYGTWIPRSLKYFPGSIKKILSVGQQLTIKWLHDEFKENFFEQPKDKVCKDFTKDMSLMLGLPYDGKHFEELHDLGYLPIRVKSLPEGIETNPNVPHMTFVNTVDGFAWLTLFLETIISAASWKMPTSATLALQLRRNVVEWVMKTCPEMAWLIPYLCHDFSARGLDPFSMITSGLGHATCFRGSDSLIVIPAARYYYGEPEDEVVINSVNASEHSVSTTKIFTVGEKQMIIDWLKEFPTGILSIVADTFDLWKLLLEYIADPEVKALILARDGKLVIRPDSGDPVDIICGLPVYDDNAGEESIYETYKDGDIFYYLQEDCWIKFNKDSFESSLREYGENTWDYIDEYYEKVEAPNKAETKGVIEILWDIFGGTTNEQGYKVLDSHIGAIYGDSINLERQIAIYERLAAKGFAACNVVLGVGSFTYQFNTRDTAGFAAKGSWFEILEPSPCIKAGKCLETESFKNTPHEGLDLCTDGCVQENPHHKTYDIYKDPVTDDGTKKSLKGLIRVNEDGSVKEQCTWEEEQGGILQTIYENGKFFNQTTFTEIRERINNTI